MATHGFVVTFTYGDRQLQLAAIERLEEIETVRCMQPTLFRSEETCRYAARRDENMSCFSH